MTLPIESACYKWFLFGQQKGQAKSVRPTRSTRDFPRVRGSETCRAGARQGRFGVRAGAVDAAEDDRVAGMQAREVARLEHADLRQTEPCCAARGLQRRRAAARDGIRDE